MLGLIQGMLESEDEEEEEVDSEGDTGEQRSTQKGAKRAKQVDEAAIEDQKAEWLQASPGEKPGGVALRCLLCKCKLLLNCGTHSFFALHLLP